MTTGNPIADEIIKAKLGNPGSSKAAGQLYPGKPSSTMFGSFLGSSTQAKMAYGYENLGSSKAPTIGITLPVQATDFMKKVKLVGYIGTQTVFEASTWMCVYREIYGPSTLSNYRNYVDTSLGLSCTYACLPFIGGQGFEGYGTMLEILENPNVYPTAGSYQILWLRWEAGGIQYGAQFDWYYVPTEPIIRAAPDLNSTPKNAGSISKSNGQDFSTIGLNSYASNGRTGINLGTMPGDSSTVYYLQDDPTEPKPKLKSAVPIGTVNKVTVQEAPVELSGPDNLKYYERLNVGDIPNVTVGKLVSVSSGTGKTIQLEYPGLVGKINGKWTPLYFGLDDAETIITHIRNGEQTFNKAQFSTTGGTAIVTSGANANCVKPTYKFGSRPNTPQTWTPKSQQGNFLPTAIVNGDDLNGTTANPETWVPGYAPADGSLLALNAARANYWYVLPIQQRKYIGLNGAPGDEYTGQLTSYESEFTSSATYVSGLHFGKFLKGEVNSARGITYSRLSEYQANLALEAANAVNERLATTSFSAFLIGTASAARRADFPAISGQAKVSLRNVEGVSISPGLTGFITGASSGVGAGTGTTPPTTGTGGNGNPGGSSVTSPSGTPKDWRKIITDSTAKLIDSASVQTLTQVQLERFLQRQANLGAPLGTLKEVFFEQLLEAKIIALQQSQGLSRVAASTAVKQDPLYAALRAFAKGLTPKQTTNTTGGTASNATASGGDPNATRTIKIDVIRGLPGYRQGIREAGASIVDQPELVQTYEVFKDGVTAGDTPPRRFVFPFVPREVNYSGIGTRWTEIERTGDYPIVDWNGFQLLKISFNFDVVDRRYEGMGGFGLYFSCEEELKKLREMAQTPYPVTFLNMDKFMREEVRWPTLSQGRGIEFVIAEFSVTAVQRTSNDSKRALGVVPNQISRATCSMTLQEIPIETVRIVQMPPIRPCKVKCEDIPKIPEEKFKEYLLLSTGTNANRG